jgi:hypothetical protein
VEDVPANFFANNFRFCAALAFRVTNQIYAFVPRTRQGALQGTVSGAELVRMF